MEPVPFGQVPTATQEAPSVSIRCPACHERGTFATALQMDVFNGRNPGAEDHRQVGLRFCPADDCRQVVTVVLGQSRRLLTSHPVELREFDMTGIPPMVLESLDEALQCEAIGAHRASALMVRRTLEELCTDRGATGDNLYARIQSLGDQIVLPTDLIDAMHNLRLLGNDAAHIEAKDYEQVSRAELDAALEVTKIIMQATYQYTNTVAKLQGLRKPPDA